MVKFHEKKHRFALMQGGVGFPASVTVVGSVCGRYLPVQCCHKLMSGGPAPETPHNTIQRIGCGSRFCSRITAATVTERFE